MGCQRVPQDPDVQVVLAFCLRTLWSGYKFGRPNGLPRHWICGMPATNSGVW